MRPGDNKIKIRNDLGNKVPFTPLAPPVILPPSGLRFEDIELLFDKYFEAPSGTKLVPFYHFKMVDPSRKWVGHLNFRVGRTRHVCEVVGHIGYFVLPEFRGHAYAYKACRAAAPFVLLFFDRVIITAEIDAAASVKTIEHLGAAYLGGIEVPEDDPAFSRGARRKRRYLWRPRPPEGRLD